MSSEICQKVVSLDLRTALTVLTNGSLSFNANFRYYLLDTTGKAKNGKKFKDSLIMMCNAKIYVEISLQNILLPIIYFSDIYLPHNEPISGAFLFELLATLKFFRYWKIFQFWRNKLKTIPNCIRNCLFLSINKRLSR